MSDGRDETQMEEPSSLVELGRRLSAVLDLIGTRRKASDVAGRSTDQLGKYEKGLTEPPFTALARLCLAANVRLEWLATGKGDMHHTAAQATSASQPLRRDDLMMAVQLANEALGNKVLPPPKYAELVTLLYELLEEGLPEAKVLHFARAAAG